MFILDSPSSRQEDMAAKFHHLTLLEILDVRRWTLDFRSNLLFL